MTHVWEGRRRAALAGRLTQAANLLRQHGWTVTEPVDARKDLATTQPSGR